LKEKDVLVRLDLTGASHNKFYQPLGIQWL
jgi:hypothetical protein